MDVYCEKRLLEKALAVIGRAVPSRPIVAHDTLLMIEASDGQVALISGTVMPRIQCVINGDVDEDGTAVVSAKVVAEAVPTLLDGHIRIRTIGAGKTLVMLSGRTTISLPTQPREEVVQYLGPTETAATVNAAELADALSALSFIQLRKSELGHENPIFRSVIIAANNSDQVELVATDGYRLGIVRLAANVREGWTGPVVVLANEVKRFADACDTFGIQGSATMATGETGGLVSFYTSPDITPAVRVAMDTIPAVVPEYHKLLQAPANITRAIVDADALKMACRAAMAVDTELEVLIGDEFISVLGKTILEDSVCSQVPATVDGQPMSFVINGKYLLRSLSAQRGPLTISATGPREPIWLDGERATYLIMPILRLGADDGTGNETEPEPEDDE